MTAPKYIARRGWGVVRMAPKQFVGLYESYALAQAKARLMGPQYVARLGEQIEGSNEFVWAVEDYALV